MNWNRTHETHLSSLDVGGDSLEISSYKKENEGFVNEGFVWVASLHYLGISSDPFSALTVKDAEQFALEWAKERLAKEIAKLSAILGDVHKEIDNEQVHDADRGD